MLTSFQSIFYMHSSLNDTTQRSLCDKNVYTQNGILGRYSSYQTQINSSRLSIFSMCLDTQCGCATVECARVSIWATMHFDRLLTRVFPAKQTSATDHCTFVAYRLTTRQSFCNTYASARSDSILWYKVTEKIVTHFNN